MRSAENASCLGHEVDTAEHDVLGLGVLLRQLGQPEGVATCVGSARDLVALVVVSEDEDPVAESCLGNRDACGAVVGVAYVPLWKRGLESKHVPLL